MLLQVSILISLDVRDADAALVTALTRIDKAARTSSAPPNAGRMRRAATPIAATLIGRPTRPIKPAPSCAGWVLY
ncbi:hypothetical protein [Mycobacterium sp.]|uniref:hypothetical protein n=1 Tax=Mycobacterium sp. TaxID=1785 RepID=UPI003BB6E765